VQRNCTDYLSSEFESMSDMQTCWVCKWLAWDCNWLIDTNYAADQEPIVRPDFNGYHRIFKYNTTSISTDF